MRVKKLAVPFLTLMLAALGCSGTAAPNAGTGGRTSATGGTIGTGGKGGDAGTSAGGGAGTGGAGISGSAGADSTNIDAGISTADCTVTGSSAATDVLTAKIFCQSLIQYCSNVNGFTLPTYDATEEACEAEYSANANIWQHCQSFYLCTGVEGTTPAPANQPSYCEDAAGVPSGDCAPG